MSAAADPSALHGPLRLSADRTHLVHADNTPFFAVTGPDGSFTLKGLPPGEYEVTVLHEASVLEAGPATATVKVGAGETKQADFTYRPKGEEKK